MHVCLEHPSTMAPNLLAMCAAFFSLALVISISCGPGTARTFDGL